MTRRRLRRSFALAIAVYVAAIAFGIVLKARFPQKDDPVYSTYKDLVPFVIAIPAAWLGLCIQQRNSYMQQLRKLWSDMIGSVQDGIQYTFLTAPSQDQYAKVLSRFSCVIEEVRGVFRNIGETGSHIGLYPFEAMKQIRRIIMDLGYEDRFNPEHAAFARREVIGLWKALRSKLLREFDRDFPSYPQSPYLPEPDESPNKSIQRTPLRGAADLGR
jgi:hypothetical protein